MLAVSIAAFLLGVIISIIAVHFLVPDKLPKSKIKKFEDTITSLKYENSSLHQELGSIESILNTKDKELDQSTLDTQKYKDLLEKAKEENRVILSQKKSSEIRTGNIVESLAPLLMENHDPKRLRWLGFPIDFIAFDENRITFIEVKSGKSQLSHSQKRVRNLIKQGRVFWEEVRIKGNKKGKKG